MLKTGINLDIFLMTEHVRSTCITWPLLKFMAAMLKLQL